MPGWPVCWPTSDAAAVVENGLAPGRGERGDGRVQILTVHAAKGLEWQIVAVPHLRSRVPLDGHRPYLAQRPAELPPLRGDRADAEFGAGFRHGVLGALDTSAVRPTEKRSPTPSRRTGSCCSAAASTRNVACFTSQ